jgi:hypothetical protein
MTKRRSVVYPMLELFAGQTFNAICVIAHWGSVVPLALASADSDFIGTRGKITLYIPPVDGVSYEELFSPSIFALLATFSGVTGLFHLYYFLNINSHDGAVRFLEYSISAPIMSAAICILTGIVDVYSIIAIAGLISTTMTFGYLEEKTAGVVDLLIRPFWLGCLPYVVAWIPITWQFIRADVPDFVVGIYIVEVLLFSAFAVVQWHFVVRRGVDNGNKLKMEGAYNLLSITSKMLLVWLTFGGLASRN